MRLLYLINKYINNICRINVVKFPSGTTIIQISLIFTV